MERGTYRLQLHACDYATALSFTLYAASATVTPICLVILSRELGFSLIGGGGIEAIRTFLLVAMLLGSGWAAAHWGKMRCLSIGNFALGTGLLLYGWAPSYAAILLAVGIAGLGGGLLEALLNPLIQDLHPTDSGRYLNFLNAFFSLGVMIVVLGGGEWLTRDGSWRAIMISLGAMSLLSGFIFLRLHRWLSPSHDSAAHKVWNQKMAVLRHPRFWLFSMMMFLGGGAEGGLTFWTASYIQLHFTALPRMGGIGTAMFAGGMFFGRILFGWCIPQNRLWTLLITTALAVVPVTFILPGTNHVGFLILLLFPVGIGIASFWPSLQSYAVDRMPLDSTVLFILLSCGGMAGFGLTPWIMGMIAEWIGLNRSLFLIPGYLVTLGALLIGERVWAPCIAHSGRNTGWVQANCSPGPQHSTRR